MVLTSNLKARWLCVSWVFVWSACFSFLVYTACTVDWDRCWHYLGWSRRIAWWQVNHDGEFRWWDWGRSEKERCRSQNSLSEDLPPDDVSVLAKLYTTARLIRWTFAPVLLLVWSLSVPCSLTLRSYHPLKMCWTCLTFSKWMSRGQLCVGLCLLMCPMSFTFLLESCGFHAPCTQDGSEDSPGGKSPLTEKSLLDDAPEAPLDLEVSGKEEPDPSEDIAMSDATLPEFGIVFFPIFVPWCAFFWISCKRWFSYHVMMACCSG